jgi:hypothetical protein
VRVVEGNDGPASWLRKSAVFTADDMHGKQRFLRRYENGLAQLERCRDVLGRRKSRPTSTGWRNWGRRERQMKRSSRSAIATHETGAVRKRGGEINRGLGPWDARRISERARMYVGSTREEVWVSGVGGSGG